MSEGEPLVEARGLVKRFGASVAVDGIDVRVERGEAFGFLGPNGAGKTSTMRMIGCTSPITEGHLRVLGLDPTTHGAQIRARLGVVAQEDNLDTELTVRENLLIYGRYFDLPKVTIAERTEQLLAFVQLSDRADSLVDPLSGGMKRRLAIARALVSQPEMILLDEPTTGLDPQARHLVWDRLHQLKRSGVSFVLTTHYMDEAERLCDRLVIMDRGRIVAEGSPRELIARHATRDVVELTFTDEADLHRAAERSHADGDRAEVVGDRVLVYTADGDAAAERLGHDGLDPARTMIRRASLEDVFLILTGRSLEE
ncbi:ABC transporter ATP-binding protein [Iamia sp. SCSIO 61187]|uniref:ABC transporter ATP-binding protein n=1 Tax=Iamia sp. SCSIO 61187 TaxID=2722752 RepID=UPI0021032441|nr:ABC transporter ATP-binding protein [Iamia sp. SCSIO 61187]QYG93951.1 ABC transporter ATP-binding protein [Iamia sp. SCSIO 61187]